MRHTMLAACFTAAMFVVALAACKPAKDKSISTSHSPSAPAAVKQAVPGKVALPLDPAPPLSAAAQIGAKLFFDQSLSGSRKMSCTSCHDPKHAYAPAHDLTVQLGGRDGKQPGTRAVPTLMYLHFV
jgi:cytochrome c peroxidase